jgi:hypothetical protein
MLAVAITPADVQDRDGFIPLLKAVRRVFVLQRIFADGGYSGAKTTAEAKRAGKVELRRPTAPTLPLIGGTTAGPLAALGENYNDCRRSRKRAFPLFCSAGGGFWPGAGFGRPRARASGADGTADPAFRASIQAPKG